MVTNEGVALVSSTYQEVLEGFDPLGKNSHLCDLLRSWLMILTQEGASLVISNPLGNFLGLPFH